MKNPAFLSLLPFLTPVVLALPTGANGDELSADKIFPKRLEIENLAGRPLITAPVRTYLEYQYGQSRSRANVIDSIDYHGSRVVVGTDFVSPGIWLWGGALAYSTARENGTAPSVGLPSVVTSKEAVGASAYVEKPLSPIFSAGVRGYYEWGSGNTLYGGVTNYETSHSYGVSPYVQIRLSPSDRIKIAFTPDLEYQRGSFAYSINVPSSGVRERLTFHLPARITFQATTQLSVFLEATLNAILSVRTFANVPNPDRTTVTLAAGATYDNLIGDLGTYATVHHVVLDRNYNSTSFRLGLFYTYN